MNGFVGYGFAPGDYCGKCRDCGCSFVGAKRSSRCEPCAIKAKDSFDRLPPAPAPIPVRPSNNIIHELKSWVGLFEPIFKGEKTHELRVMDRLYVVGDILRLREYDPLTKTYTGREATVEVTYITSSLHKQCAVSPTALHPATGVLSIKLLHRSAV